MYRNVTKDITTVYIIYKHVIFGVFRHSMINPMVIILKTF